MKSVVITAAVLLAGWIVAYSGVNPGDRAPDFSLRNVDGSTVSLSDYENEKGVIVVFTCNPCPFAKAYEQRIIQLHQKYADKGFPVVAINPNDAGVSPEDAFDKMKERSTDRNYPFPYLKDESQEVYQSYGATRTPHIYLLKNDGGTFRIAYVGAIDDNAMDASGVSQKYLEDALASVMAGDSPDPATTKAVGCTIKAKS
ncbi:MAG: thioredoxin family protein [Bacteroidetes bacterium]|nr:MAG: thioredoxin family protein [Bacteroidota bacterium]